MPQFHEVVLTLKQQRTKAQETKTTLEKQVEMRRKKKQRLEDQQEESTCQMTTATS